jgi:hypothetical protein
MIPALGVIATGAESLFGLLLLVGWYTRVTALLSGLLLIVFGVSMALGLGVKAPLDYAVFTGAGGAFLLATCERFPFSVDELLFRRTHSEEDRRKPHELQESVERDHTPRRLGRCHGSRTTRATVGEIALGVRSVRGVGGRRL